MPKPNRKRNLSATCRRALELLVGSRDGATEAIVAAWSLWATQW
jgi:hypothetical protein